MDKLFSSLLAFILALVPAGFSKAPEIPNNQTTIIFTGDIMLGRSVMGQSLDMLDNLYPFRKSLLGKSSDKLR